MGDLPTFENATKEQHDAAIKLQKVERGRSVRKDLAAKGKAGKDDSKAQPKADAAAKSADTAPPPRDAKAEEIADATAMAEAKETVPKAASDAADGDPKDAAATD